MVDGSYTKLAALGEFGFVLTMWQLQCGSYNRAVTIWQLYVAITMRWQCGESRL